MAGEGAVARSSEAFKLGDIVQLKSGGPKMTVVGLPGELGNSGRFATSWFAGSKNEHGRFPIEALMEVKDEQKNGD